MRREGRITGKPCNHSKFTGKCGKPRCLMCHSHPVNKSLGKVKGCLKLKAYDVTTNYLLQDWWVSPPNSGSHAGRKGGRPALYLDFHDTESQTPETSDRDEGPSEGEASAMAMIVETMMKDLQYQGEESNAEEPELEVFSGAPIQYELENTIHEGENFDIFEMDIEDGYQNASVGDSDDSWSGISLSDDDKSQCCWEDDWSLVDMRLCDGDAGQLAQA